MAPDTSASGGSRLSQRRQHLPVVLRTWRHEREYDDAQATTSSAHSCAPRRVAHKPSPHVWLDHNLLCCILGAPHGRVLGVGWPLRPASGFWRPQEVSVGIRKGGVSGYVDSDYFGDPGSPQRFRDSGVAVYDVLVVVWNFDDHARVDTATRTSKALYRRARFPFLVLR